MVLPPSFPFLVNPAVQITCEMNGKKITSSAHFLQGLGSCSCAGSISEFLTHIQIDIVIPMLFDPSKSVSIPPLLEVSSAAVNRIRSHSMPTENTLSASLISGYELYAMPTVLICLCPEHHPASWTQHVFKNIC